VFEIVTGIFTSLEMPGRFTNSGFGSFFSQADSTRAATRIISLMVLMVLPSYDSKDDGRKDQHHYDDDHDYFPGWTILP